MRRWDAVPARQKLLGTLRRAGGVVNGDDPRLLGFVVGQPGGEAKAAGIEKADPSDTPPVAAAHEINDLLACGIRVQANRKAMLWRGPRDPPGSRDCVH